MFRKGKGGRLESLYNQLSKETGSQSGEFSALQSSSNETERGERGQLHHEIKDHDFHNSVSEKVLYRKMNKERFLMSLLMVKILLK